MRSAPTVVALAVALVVHAPGLAAQAPADSVMPRAGSWGAQAMYGGGLTATLLYFSSPSAAWVTGASFTVHHESTDEVVLTTPTTSVARTQTRVVAFVDARLGRRWFTGDARSRLQPLRGLGLAGSYANYSYQKSYTAGVYGELGADYFFTPHLSLGASGEMVASYGQDRSSPDRVTTRWALRGSLARVGAAVYF